MIRSRRASLSVVLAREPRTENPRTENQIALERRTSSDARWFADWFDSPHYHQLYGYRDEAEAARFVDALVDRLRPKAGADLLDLGCGAGRHSKHLASKRLSVTGMDLAASSIAQAQRFGRPGLRFVRQDMRTPFGRESFDFVANFFTSFGYFEKGVENLKVVANIARSLRSGGTLVLDYLNVQYAEARVTPEEVKTIDDTTYRMTRWSGTRHFFKRIRIEVMGAKPIEFVEKVAKFRLEDFRAMFRLQGLSIEEVFGDYRLNPYDAETSPRLILVAKKMTSDVAALPYAS